jgi:hypothetical protein
MPIIRCGSPWSSYVVLPRAWVQPQLPSSFRTRYSASKTPPSRIARSAAASVGARSSGWTHRIQLSTLPVKSCGRVP